MRTYRRGGLLVSFGLAAGGLVVATAPALPALASGQVCAGIVIDSGPGGPATLTQGASVAPGSSDLDLLNAAGDTFKPNDSGLVCLINGYPPDGLQNCLQAAHGLFYYWSYWEGDPATNTWTYAAVGPAEHTVEAGQSYVEGWRYQDPGPASPAAAKPSVTPTAAFAQACLRVPPTTTTTTAGGSGAAGSSTTTTAAAPAHAPAAAVVGPQPGTKKVRTRGESPAATTTTTTQADGEQIPPQAAGDVATSTTSASTNEGQSTPKTSNELALANPAEHRGSGGDPALPIVLVVIIAMLGATAWLIWRRRPKES
jgi:hypothetical protein